MKNNWKKFLTPLYIATVLLLVPSFYAHAQTSGDLTVTPAVIDEKGQARDILKETITVKNMANHVLELYPSVNNINEVDGKQTFSVARNSDDLSASLANWIELSRGVVQLSPGEQKTISFIIRLNLNAVPGMYHAQISLTEGETRELADAKPPLGTVLVNLEVKSDAKELLQLNKFSTDNVLMSGDDVLFNYQLQNIGNQDLQPRGQIHIYDRRGQEVATIDANKDGKTVSPDQMSQMASVWTAADGFGRYKAMLDVTYGSSQTATVQDTVFFWIVPWKEVLGLFVASLVTIIMLSLYFHRWLERRHLHKFAHAGLLTDAALEKIHTEELIDVPAPLPQWVREHATPAPPLEKKPEQKPEQKRLREVLQRQERPVTHGSAIDLKQLKAQNQAAKAHAHPVPTAGDTRANRPEMNGHVISLKKK